MKKRMIAMVLPLLLSFSLAVPAAAGTTPANPPRLEDRGELLTEKEEEELKEKLDEISDRQQLDVVVVTAGTLEGKTPMAYADDFFDENGYGQGPDRDGILLLVSMEERDWWISTSGYGITVFTDYGIEYISEQFLPELSDGEYLPAFETFADECDTFITEARENKPFDSNHVPKEAFPFFFYLAVSLIIGFIISFLSTGVMKSKLKSVRAKNTASDYVRKGSMNVTESRDLFLYAHTDRRERPKSSSSGGGSRTHSSSSGRSHGGGGGKF